jgi:hypothetical protein
LNELYPFCGVVELIPLPGAPMSTLVAPKFEKEDSAPLSVIDATAITAS